MRREISAQMKDKVLPVTADSAVGNVVKEARVITEEDLKKWASMDVEAADDQVVKAFLSKLIIPVSNKVITNILRAALFDNSIGKINWKKLEKVILKQMPELKGEIPV